MNNETLTSIRQRRSCRQYQERQITDAELQTVLEAGTWAPTAHGKQDPVIVAVQNVELRQEIVRLNAQVRGKQGDPFYGAPTIVLVFGTESDPNHLQDGSLVLGTMMLAAHSIGLASCWINREIELFQLPEGRELKARLGISDHMGGVGALALGYAAAPAPAPRERKADYYRIIK